VRILILGDSITVGMAPFLGPALEQLGHEGVIVAEEGISTRQVATEQAPRALREDGPFDVALVMLGTNPYGDMIMDTWAADVSALLRVLSGGGVPVVTWISPWAGTDMPMRLSVLARTLPGLTLNGEILAQGIPRVGENHVHFDRDGYRELARRVVAWIRQLVVPSAARAGKSNKAARAGVAAVALGIAAGIPLIWK
jgi:lysophospholipase L1-like esterase